MSTGMAIGLLQTGDRLPSEEVMAQVLGVSGLTFRQSLERLRVRNLVTTRPGRGGGTIISPRPEDLKALAETVLASSSTSGIADLGTTFAALISQAARLAALRHDGFDDARLEDTLGPLADAETPVHRRRLSTLFLVSVTSVARSETLMEIVVPVIGNVQSMLWIDSGDSLHDEITNDATHILAAIVDSNPDLAARLAREHGERLTSHLITRRARQYAQDGNHRDGFDTLVGRLDAIRVALEYVAGELRFLEPARAKSTDVLDRLFCDVVDQHASLVRGAGIAYAPGMLPGRPLWMDWWDSGDSEELAFKSHAFNVVSLQYYDYTRMAWFTEPLRTGAFGAHGPYLDRGGIERVTVTVSLPVSTPGFAGSVLGADLRLSQIGELFFANTNQQDAQKLLLDAHERVVVSAVPGLMPGDVVTSETTGDLTRIAPGVWPGLGELGWHTAHIY